MSQPKGKKTDNLLQEAYEITKIPNNRELDVLLSTGEQISIAKLSMLLISNGYDAVSLTGWQAGIYTNNVNQNAIIEQINTDRINKELEKRKNCNSCRISGDKWKRGYNYFRKRWI